MRIKTITSILHLSRRLIEFESTAQRLDQREAILEFCRTKIHPKAKVKIHRFRKAPVLLASLKGQGPRLCFYAHLDVVPAARKGFRPKVKNGRLYGRGSGDMKGAAAVLIQLFNDLAEQSQVPNIDLLLTTDEEVGGEGVHSLLKKGYHCDAVLIPDNGSGLSNLILEQKGMLELILWRKGKAAHGSVPDRGMNAIELLHRDYERIKRIFHMDRKKTWASTLNLGQFHGGLSNNQVPSYAEMALDIRYTKERQRLRIFKKLNEINPNIEILSDFPPFIQEKEAPAIQVFKKCLEAVGLPVTFSREAGASDARFFSHHGIPAIVTGIAKKNIHAENEWCSLRELDLFYKIVKDFVEKMNGGR